MNYQKGPESRHCWWASVEASSRAIGKRGVGEEVGCVTHGLEGK